MNRYEWFAVEKKIRHHCHLVGRTRQDVESTAAKAEAEAARDAPAGEACLAAANAAQGCATVASSMYEQALKLWYECPDHAHYDSPAGRQTMHMLTVAWSDTVSVWAVVHAAERCATEALIFGENA